MFQGAEFCSAGYRGRQTNCSEAKREGSDGGVAGQQMIKREDDIKEEALNVEMNASH